MKSKARKVLIVLSILLTLMIIWSVCEYRNTPHPEDLITINDQLADDPVIFRTRGKNSIETIRIRMAKFQGRDFSINTNSLTVSQRNNLVSDLKWKSEVSLNFLKDDIRELRNGWRECKIYGLSSGEKVYLNSLEVIADEKSDVFLIIVIELIFLTIFLILLILK